MNRASVLLKAVVVFWSLSRPVAEHVVAAYLPEYRWYVDLEAALRCCVSDLILFSVSPRDNGSVDDHWIPSENIARARRAADAVPDRVVNVLLCVGGAGRSAGFAKATSTAKRRRRFVANLEALLEEHSLDGVDFDWEAPRNDEEMANYVLLLRAASRALRSKNKLVTVALHPGQSLKTARLPGDGDVGSPYDFVDRVHLMAYDMVSRDQSRHSTLEDASSAARHQLGEGLLSHKLALGVPAYGRHMQRPGEVKTFAEIYDELRPLQHPHRSHKHAHFDSDITESGYFFNGPSTVRAKANWANDQGFAGVVIWELGQDKLGTRSSLLAAAADASGFPNALPEVKFRGDKKGKEDREL
jgi:GH18 family chitinase